MSDQVNEKQLSTADLAGSRPMDTGQATNPVTRGNGEGSLPAGATRPMPAAQAQDARPMPLLASAESENMRTRWSTIQTGFVDDPRHAVEMADTLVAEMMQRLAQLFANQRGQLEGQWSSGKDVSTEELRLALRQYRSFFDRLLTI